MTFIPSILNIDAGERKKNTVYGRFLTSCVMGGQIEKYSVKVTMYVFTAFDCLFTKKNVILLLKLYKCILK